MIEYWVNITRHIVQENPYRIFVFGDNLKRIGFGGQAKEMRGEPNAVGIPTKKAPSMDERAFLTDMDYDHWRLESDKDIQRLLNYSGSIVWPSFGIGTGRAQLKTRAPKIWSSIVELQKELGGL